MSEEPMHTIHACPECVQARQQRAEIDRLREIVARLPTTKDGKAVTDNDLVFCVYELQIQEKDDGKSEQGTHAHNSRLPRVR